MIFQKRVDFIHHQLLFIHNEIVQKAELVGRTILDGMSWLLSDGGLKIFRKLLMPPNTQLGNTSVAFSKVMRRSLINENSKFSGIIVHSSSTPRLGSDIIFGLRYSIAE